LRRKPLPHQPLQQVHVAFFRRAKRPPEVPEGGGGTCVFNAQARQNCQDLAP
jgi:hypothetical protein